MVDPAGQAGVGGVREQLEPCIGGFRALRLVAVANAGMA